MPISERAKQFSPFSPLSGLKKALEEKEKIKVAKPELSDDMKGAINEKLKTSECGTMLSVTYFENGEYIKTENIKLPISIDTRSSKVAEYCLDMGAKIINDVSGLECDDKMINKYGGRIVGIYRQEAKLIDGEYYDLKMYEILASEYFKTIKKK